MVKAAAEHSATVGYQSLLRSVADDLKLPLLQIARAAELGELTGEFSLDTFGTVQVSAKSALALIDSYTLGLELAEHQQVLALEPVSTASVLYDAAQSLSDIAKQSQVAIELEIKGNYGLVMAHRAGLQAALFSLGMAFIDAAASGDQKATITLGTHHGSAGVVAGIYSETATAISPAQLKAAYLLQPQARRPLSQFSSTGSAGIFIAHNILQAMAAPLRSVRHHKQAGLVTVLQPSRQLQLV